MRSLVLIASLLIACGGDDGGSKVNDAPGSGSDAPVADGPGGGDGPGGVDASIAVGPACDGVTCTNGQQDCCLGAPKNVCEPAGTCPSQGFACDGPEDCSGSECCFGNGGQGGATCRASCAAIACHGDGDCPTAASKCCAKAFTPGYRVCQVQC